jgi:hypothetical protein
MDMQYYITKIATVFKVYDYPKQRLPMPFPITDLRPLDPDEAAEFRAIVGANGWVVLSVMLTSKAAQSCIAAFLSKPVAGAFLQARQMAAYHFQNRHLRTLSLLLLRQAVCQPGATLEECRELGCLSNRSVKVNGSQLGSER